MACKRCMITAGSKIVSKCGDKIKSEKKVVVNEVEEQQKTNVKKRKYTKRKSLLNKF